MPEPDWRQMGEPLRGQIVGFGQRLLRAASLSGDEREAAELLLAEMRTLGYDRAWIDKAGNVIGLVRGGPGRSVMLHAHLDVVDPGDVAAWRYPPFSGHSAEGYLWGRGASDDKGCVIAQVYAGGLLLQSELRPLGDVYVVGVVGEENGGVGTRHLVQSLTPDLAIIGEPSGNTIRRGHRGRFEFIVTMRGRSAHASVPHNGVNPHYSLARFLLELRETPLMIEPVFGGTTVTPTLSYVDQTSSNVIPAEATVHLDWRNAPGETVPDARAILDGVVGRSIEEGVIPDVRLKSDGVRTYTGLEMQIPQDVGSFYMEEDDPLLLAAIRSVERGLGRKVGVDVWRFCTDGGFVRAAGVPCIGFGPGEELMAHVLDERIQIDQLVEAVGAYAALAHDMGDRDLPGRTTLDR